MHIVFSEVDIEAMDVSCGVAFACCFVLFRTDPPASASVLQPYMSTLYLAVCFYRIGP